MIHSPIQIHNLNLSFLHKTCFENFTTTIHHSNRIAIIGRNGSGKTALLNILLGKSEPSEGYFSIPSNVVLGYVPQITQNFSNLSGGKKFCDSLSKVMLCNPNVLMLDEPTNHLDQANRKFLFNILSRFRGTLIAVSHDPEFIKSNFDIIWYIDNGIITIFKGSYDNFVIFKEVELKKISLKLSSLNIAKKESHLKLMKEQKRANNSKLKGEKDIRQNKRPTIVFDEKARGAAETSGRKKSGILQKKQEVLDRLSQIKIPEIITPKFSLHSRNHSGNIANISNGSCGYENNVLDNIYLQIGNKDRIAIKGSNGSGKTTLIKAILNKPEIRRSGEWHIINQEFIGYLDQNYNNLVSFETPLQAFESIVPNWSHIQIRTHLNDFLFRKNEEVNMPIVNLSGGERVRLSLALIAADPPQLLILDEITNNLDIETKEHVTQILKFYPTAMIVISHDENFLKEIDLTGVYDIKNAKLT